MLARSLDLDARSHGPGEPLEELLARLGTTPAGLSPEEAARRCREHGPNELATTSLGRRVMEVVRSIVNPLVVILVVAAVASALLGEPVEASIIGAIVLLSTGLNLWQTSRSARAVRRLQDRITPTATVRRGGAWIEARAASSPSATWCG